MKNLTSVKQRISYYIDNKNIGITKFYRESGITYGVLSQKSNLSEENIVKFLTTYSEVSSDWLLLGKGSMLREAAEPTQSVADHKNVEEEVSWLKRQVDSLTEMNKNLTEVNKILAAGNGDAAGVGAAARKAV